MRIILSDFISLDGVVQAPGGREEDTDGGFEHGGWSMPFFDPEVMGGRPCIRGMRVTVGTVVGLVAAGHTHDEILRLYPYLESQDISEALAYAAWRSDEFEVPISSS